ncbi:MAG: glycosyltransferase [Actinomycetota bacterium]
MPRERWSLAVRSLDATLAVLPSGTQLVYVDGGSPADIRDQLKDRVTGYGGLFVHRQCVLAPNEARNLGLAECDRDYVIVHDNDIFPRPGWAEALVQCADETNAGMVGPLVFHGFSPDVNEIHIAGGEIAVDDAGVMIRNDRFHSHQQLSDLPTPLERAPTSQIEYHSCLFRREAIQPLLPLDEEIRSMADHEDVTMAIADLGYPLMFEPTSEVAYLLMQRIDPIDRGFWQLRWSNDWNRRSLDRFCSKWELARDRGWPELAERWAAGHRSWWMHGNNRFSTMAGRALRRAARNPWTSRPARIFDEMVLSRDGRRERQRRVQHLGRA